MEDNNKITYVVIAVLSAMAMGLLIYGALMHEEAGLMGVCFENGIPKQYEPNGADECPPVQWDRDRFPLKVFGTNARPGINYDAAGVTKSAIDAVNSRLGFDAMEWIDGQDADVVVTIGYPTGEGFLDAAGGDARLTRSDGRLLCFVRTANVSSEEMLHWVLYHELGHCLGLAHDESDQSIMRPRQHGQRWFGPWISDSDRSLLRELYGPS